MGIRLSLRLPPGLSHQFQAGLEVAAQACFASVEVWLSDLEQHLDTYSAAWLDAYLRSRGIYLLGVYGLEPLSALPPLPLLQVGQAAEPATLEAQVLSLSARIDALGGGIVTLCAEAHPDWGGRRERGIAYTVRQLRLLAGLSAAFDVQLALLAPGSENSSIPTLKEGRLVCRQAAHPAVRLALDVSAVAGSRALESEIAALERDRIAVVRISLPEALWSPSSEGDAHLPRERLVRVLRVLSERGFSGPYTVCLPPGIGLAPDGAVRARRMTTDLLRAAAGELPAG